MKPLRFQSFQKSALWRCTVINGTYHTSSTHTCVTVYYSSDVLLAHHHSSFLPSAASTVMMSVADSPDRPPTNTLVKTSQSPASVHHNTILQKTVPSILLLFVSSILVFKEKNYTATDGCLVFYNPNKCRSFEKK
jgi:hypothetical protein